jgi:hypothetical protein
MDARQIAGRFAAYTWYMEVRFPRKPIEAARFARTHWQAFVPVVHAGLGRLLHRIACGPAGAAARVPRKQHPKMKRSSSPDRRQGKAIGAQAVRA